jgi:peroxiredoxin
MKVGDTIKNFQLKDHNDQIVSIENIKGKRILLSFHPLAWTQVCAQQMQSIDNNFSKIDGLRTVPFGVSIDSSPSKLAWAKVLNLSHLRLLSDFWPHGAVANDLGIFRKDDGFSERANIILDDNKTIIFFKVYPIKLLPDINEIIEFLKNSYHA